MEYPVILPKFKPIITWSKEMREVGLELYDIVNLLLVEKKENINEEITIYRQLYKEASFWKNEILKAILMEGYRTTNDIHPYTIVVNLNEDRIGIAFNFDYKERIFELHESTKLDESSLIGEYNIDDFHIFEYNDNE